jgi:hypothetical protein
MYIVRVSGGLGNQLFQLGFAFYLEKKFSCCVKLDLSFFCDQYNILYENYLKFNKIEKRKYEFMNNSPFEICDDNELALTALGFNDKKKVNFVFLSVFKFAALIFSWTLLFKIFSRNIINDLNFKSKKYDNKSLIFSGYWQEKIYFFQFEMFIKNSLSDILNKVNPKYFHFSGKYNLDEYIVIHVRKGDYSFLKKYFDLDFVYYKNAVLFIRNIKPDLNKILIITNDRDWCLCNLQFEEYIIEFSNSNFHDDFSLMKNAKFIVTSNSTFSFWAAFLGQPIIVTHPNLWYIDKEFGYIPISWYSINCLI